MQIGLKIALAVAGFAGHCSDICCRDADRWQQEFQPAARRACSLCQRDGSRVRPDRKPRHLYRRGRGRYPRGGGRSRCRAGFCGRGGTRAARQARLSSQIFAARFGQIQGTWRLDPLRQIDVVGSPLERPRSSMTGRRFNWSPASYSDSDNSVMIRCRRSSYARLL
jgi:hypothetical protein